MTSMNRISSAINVHARIEHAQVMIGSVEQAYRSGQAVHEVEQELLKPNSNIEIKEGGLVKLDLRAEDEGYVCGPYSLVSVFGSFFSTIAA